MTVHFNKPGGIGGLCGLSPGDYSDYQNEVTCPACLGILKVLNELEAMSQEELDEEVCDAKSEEAAEINNQGREAQIAYLLS
jgi:hypothetical protein